MSSRSKSQPPPLARGTDKKRRRNIYLPSDLDRRARLYAAERGSSLSDLIAEGLARVVPVTVRVFITKEPSAGPRMIDVGVTREAKARAKPRRVRR